VPFVSDPIYTLFFNRILGRSSQCIDAQFNATNPFFPALRSSHELPQRPSPKKQFLSNKKSWLSNEQGADFGEEIERRASDAKLIIETAEKYGIPVEMLWKPA
jgi:hypothetical protein